MMTTIRTRLTSHRLLSWAMVAGLGTGLGGCDDRLDVPPVARADLILIDSLSAFGVLDRPPVAFLHDEHTAAIADRDNICETCHLPLEDGRLSPQFKRRQDADKETIMAVYHDNCIACHKETCADGDDAGPVTCGECHRISPGWISSRRPMGFDRSLHHRHSEEMEAECEQCHHEYDESTDELFYAEGEESTCRYCHLTQPVDETPSLSEATHWACVGCHLVRPDAGPVNCAGCHDAEQQRQIEVVEDPPRYERNQPDFTLLRANNLDSSRVSTVPFPHREHEDNNTTCRICHHRDMAPCTECHTLTGSTDGEGVSLQRAMHAMDSDRSCIGCHDHQKADTACAGCHALMEQGKPSEHGCVTCHSGPPPRTIEAVEDRYTSLDQFRPISRNTRLSFAASDIPDSVTVGILSDKYEPVVFPHRQIVQRLMEYISDSRIATFFHGHEDVVCQGCHHHSPIGLEPPLCESCHGEPFNESEPFKPGLFGAYHRQCLGCHQSMHIDEPSTCEGCHAEKPVQESG